MVAGILAFFQLFSNALSLSTLVLDKKFSEEIDNEEQQRVRKYQAVMDMPLNDARRTGMRNVVYELSDATRTPIRRLSGTSIEVPVECYDTLVQMAIKSVSAQQKLSKYENALLKK